MISKYRRKITNNRGGAPGRKTQPYDGPVRHPKELNTSPPPQDGPLQHPGELNVTGSGRFQESWRRPGPESIGGRSMRSMRSEQSARGALLTGAGALVPGQFSEGSHEACPQCGLRLPDVVQLAKHVETRHGGRAFRKREAAAAAAVPEIGRKPKTPARLKTMKAAALKRSGSSGVPAATPTPSRGGSRRGTDIPHMGPLAAAVAAAGEGANPPRLSRPRSISPSSGNLDRQEPRPQLLPHQRDGGGEDPRDYQSAAAAAAYSVADKAALSSLPVRATNGAAGENDSGSRSSRETGRRSADPRKPPSPESYGGESGRRQGQGQGQGQGRQGRGRESEVAPGFERSERGLAKGESSRSLTRTSSLDRISALSSRAIARSTSQKAENDNTAQESAVGGTAGDGGGGGRDNDGAANEAARAKMISRRRIRRSASTEDAVPSAHRLTADGLRALGSGLPESFKLPPPVFSPVKASAKEPAYSPVAREKAGELDKERPVSLTRKFFRQLSGDG